MFVQRKTDIVDGMVVSSNVTEADETEWDSTNTPHAADDVVMVTTTANGASEATHKIYTSTAGSNNEDPTLRTTYLVNAGTPTEEEVFWWTEEESTDRWKAFDEIPQDQTEKAGSINYEMAIGEIVDSLSLINLQAQTAQVVVTDPTDGEVYNETIDLQDYSAVIDYYQYFFEPIRRRTEFIFRDLPPYSNATIDLTVSLTGGTAKVGAAVFGKFAPVGEALYGAQFGIKDFSQVEESDTGRITVKKRIWSKKADIQVAVEKTEEAFVFKTLSELLRRNTVYAGDTGDDATILYGFFEDFTVLYDNAGFSILNLKIRGLTR